MPEIIQQLDSFAPVAEKRRRNPSSAPRKKKIIEIDSTQTQPQTQPQSNGRRQSLRLIRKAMPEPEPESESEKDKDPGLLGLGSHSECESDHRTTRAPRVLKGDRPDPKRFGHIPGSEVGKKWEFRMACSQDGVHAPVVAGISGNEHEGVWSVALSGGYEDDIDLGYAFTYTGSGGRDLKGTANKPKNLRTAPQTFDQTFTALNAALVTSVETGKPVRVIRGFKGQSCFAPETGYRYDGLYTVTKYWLDVGDAGFKVCRYSFKRLDGQPDIPVQPGREAEAEEIVKMFKKPKDAKA